MIMRIAAAGLVLLQSVGVGYSGGYYRSSCGQSYYAPAYVQKEVIREIPVLRFIDIYTASYEPVSYSSTYTSTSSYASASPLYSTQPLLAVQKFNHPQSSCEQKYEALSLEVQQMKQMMQSGGNPQRLASRATGGVFMNRCAACHSETTAATKGDNMILLRNGQPDNWTAEIREKIYDQITTQQMPKGSKLSAEELSEAVTYMREMRKTASSQRSVAPAAPQQPQLEEYPAEPQSPAKP